MRERASPRTPRSRLSPLCASYIDTWRWAGVPFYIRAGKCLPVTTTDVVVTMKRPPIEIFDEIEASESNYFRFQLSPEVIISL